ncbi:MAG TPA: hypothetical protein VFZ40_19035 [Pyrinomonadaceae bacterium]
MIRAGGVCGVLGIVIYLALAISDPYIGPQTKTTQEFLAAWGTPKYIAINMALHFAVAGAAVLWLVSFVGLKRLLDAESPSVMVRVGTLLGIIACAVMAQMMIVQGSVMSKMGQAFLSATSESERESAVALYRGLRFIDYAMDLTFDLFFFTAWILLGLKMLRHQNFGKLFGGIGLILFVLAAIMNLRAAPDPPAFDVGPLAALWLLAVYVQMLRVAKSETKSSESGVGDGG